MLSFVIRRTFYAIPALIAVSFISFMVIALPPGDFVDRLAQERAALGDTMTATEIQSLRAAYGLDRPVLTQYWTWISGIVLRGDFGYSFSWNLPVSEVIWPRIGLTVVLSVASLLFIWVVAIPIGIYSAVRRYSVGDYVFTFIGFLGLAIPNFLLALAVMYVAFTVFGQHVGGLFSPQYVEAPWSWGKVMDLFAHLWLPMIVLGTAGTANVIRVIRANLIDEVRKPYVTAARAKGMVETRLLLKYPVRHALNPFVSSQNDIFVDIISGGTIVAIVMGLQTTGPLLLDALRTQDMNMAASFILMLSVLVVLGTLLSDLVLGWLDPRIRYQQG
ncbi:ABC transporter permease [Pelagibacterium lentulum]|uniref:ABC transporter permease n=1 Tax=Pelagibacterium lentulum TaxID=2029865 RepID=A0A916R6V6_9HYPH|nr:ABC transporter permease [Pelagibacterium lentulum]GGA40499.1 ABC transporter permease [Pelagibacterium lentulum]